MNILGDYQLINILKIIVIIIYNVLIPLYLLFSQSLQCQMKFGIYLPPGESKDEKFPVLFYLSGLTCSEQNVITKAGYQRFAAQYKIIVVAPDTSPSTFSQCINCVFVLMAYHYFILHIIRIQNYVHYIVKI